MFSTFSTFSSLFSLNSIEKKPNLFNADNSLEGVYMANYVGEFSLNCLPLLRKQTTSKFLNLQKKNRTHLEIMALILEVVKDNGVTRSSVMKHACVNSTQLNNFLGFLVNTGFIETYVKEGRILYRASEKGIAFLRQYCVLLGMLVDVQTQNDLVNAVCEVKYGKSNWQQQSAKRILTQLQHTP